MSKSSYFVGIEDGKANARSAGGRRYETDNAEERYWWGYAIGVSIANPGKAVVRCEREGKVFASVLGRTVECPTCRRVYVLEGEKWISDRELTIIYEKPEEHEWQLPLGEAAKLVLPCGVTLRIAATTDKVTISDGEGGTYAQWELLDGNWRWAM